MTGLKAVVGKKYHSEEIQHEITKVAYSMTESLGNVTIPVRPSTVPDCPQGLLHSVRVALPHAPLPVAAGRCSSRANRAS